MKWTVFCAFAAWLGLPVSSPSPGRVEIRLSVSWRIIGQMGDSEYMCVWVKTQTSTTGIFASYVGSVILQGVLREVFGTFNYDIGPFSPTGLPQGSWADQNRVDWVRKHLREEYNVLEKRRKRRRLTDPLATSVWWERRTRADESVPT